MEILLLRHGKTRGNLEGRYVGRTDEPLLPSTAEELKQSGYRGFCPDLVYASPMLRCRQTAELLFPEMMCGGSEFPELRRETGGCPDRNRLILCEGFREMDFGAFEYKTYEELKGLPEYRDWIAGGGTGTVPGGESGTAFRERCRASFLSCLRDATARDAGKIAVVTHGGVIMSVMEAFARPRADFYHWQLKNGCGYQVYTENNCFCAGERSVALVFGKFVTDKKDKDLVRKIRDRVFRQECGLDLSVLTTDEMCLDALVFAGEEPAGMGRIFFDGTDFKITEVAVLPEYRGEKYGDFMVRLLIDKAVMSGARETGLDALPGTEGFFRAIGFEEKGSPYEECGITRQPMVLYTDRIHKCCG